MGRTEPETDWHQGLPTSLGTGGTMQGLSLPIPKENLFKYTMLRPIESQLEGFCEAQTERLRAKLHVSLAEFIPGLCDPNGMLQQLERSSVNQDVSIPIQSASLPCDLH